MQLSKRNIRQNAKFYSLGGTSTLKGRINGSPNKEGSQKNFRVLLNRRLK